MNICNCLFPVRIRDPYHHDRFRYVPCGKCDVCRNRSSQDWVHRLQRESECWQYTYFFTLTYDDAHLPYCTYDSKLCRLIDVSTGRVFDYIPNRKELAFIRKQKRISYPNVIDHQLFIKRLRYYFYEYKKHHLSERGVSNSIRYFTTFEYGPTTHRIHLHGLFFFNDSCGEFSKQLPMLVNRCWQNGITDCQAVQSGASAKYVAKYSNISSRCKGLFAAPEFRVKHIQSKNPPIGSLLVNNATIRQLLNSATPYLRVQLADKYTDNPLPMYLKDRLWPKVPGFDRLTDSELCTIYSCAKWTECTTPEQFVKYVTDIFTRCYNDYRPLADVGFFYYVSQLIDFSNKDPFTALKRLFRISRRVLVQCDSFNISLTNYIALLKKYYQNVQRENLRKWFALQESSQRSCPKFPIQCWVSLDSDFMAIIENNPLKDIPDWVLMTLDGFGLDAIKFCTDARYRARYDARRYPLWTSYVSKIKKMYDETSKIKSKKEYERSHGYSLINKVYAKYF